MVVRVGLEAQVVPQEPPLRVGVTPEGLEGEAAWEVLGVSEDLVEASLQEVVVVV